MKVCVSVSLCVFLSLYSNNFFCFNNRIYKERRRSWLFRIGAHFQRGDDDDDVDDDDEEENKNRKDTIFIITLFLLCLSDKWMVEWLVGWLVEW